jgi:acyl transferase domain-containing protein/thioesterase domain-containing protein
MTVAERPAGGESPFDSSRAIAVVGVAGRYIGAGDVDEFWSLLYEGRHGFVDVSEDSLIAAGVSEDLRGDSRYVRRGSQLPRLRRFDAKRFGIAARDAELMDPQTRHLLELSDEALEGAGINPTDFDGSIGVFAGCGPNLYLMNHLLPRAEIVAERGWFGLRHNGNDKDFLATTVAYGLRLEGPAISVQTACSTSLVAVHMAAQSLLGYECDAALAGGVTIDPAPLQGYDPDETEVLSPSGTCHPFDASADGTMLTSGGGVVVLRRYDDAVGDGDPILAVIMATAVNNDGRRKVSYFAPSVQGQVDVVREALDVAGLTGPEVELVHTHGTATPLGDPIEVRSLASALHPENAEGPVSLVSVKANVGHTDTAAGVASLTGAIFGFRHGWVQPNAGFHTPNPALDLSGSGFSVSATGRPWASAHPTVGVHSLGVGGTNAHAIVRAPVPKSEQLQPADNENPHVLLLSADGIDELSRFSERVAITLDASAPPGRRLAEPLHSGDVAATLATRPSRRFRRAVTGTSAAALTNNLRAYDLAQIGSCPPGTTPRVMFVYPGAGRPLNRALGALLSAPDPRFDVLRNSVASLLDTARAVHGLELGPLIWPADGSSLAGAEAATEAEAARLGERPELLLPALAIIEIAMTAQLASWGVHPDAVVGHSAGEVAAAVSAGLLSETDGLALAVLRGRAMADAALVTPGATVAVGASAHAVAELLRSGSHHVALAADNGPDECAVSGPQADVDRFVSVLADAGFEARRIGVAAPAHSQVMDSAAVVMSTFRSLPRNPNRGAGLGTDAARSVAPVFISTVTGTALQELPVDYWSRQIREQVQFRQAVGTGYQLLASTGGAVVSSGATGPVVVVEVGPNHAMTAMVRRSVGPVSSVTLGDSTVKDVTALSLIQAGGQMWAFGCSVDRSAIAPATPRRVWLPVPTPVGDEYWVDPAPAVGRQPDLAPIERAQSISWVPADGQRGLPGRREILQQRWSLLTGTASTSQELSGAIHQQLVGAGAIVTVTALDDANGHRDVDQGNGVVIVVETDSTPAACEQLVTIGSLIASLDGSSVTQVIVVSIPGAPAKRSNPSSALLNGLALVGPAEYPLMNISVIEADRSSSVRGHTSLSAASVASAAAAVSRVALSMTPPGVFRCRNNTLEVRQLAPTITAEPITFPAGPAVVLGGGHLGTAFALWAVDRGATSVELTTTDRPSDAMKRPNIMALHKELSARSIPLHIEQLRLSSNESEIDTDMRAYLEQVVARSGRPTIAINAIGVLATQLLAQIDASTTQRVITAKLTVSRLLADLDHLDDDAVVICCSSTSGIVGVAGQAAYAGLHCAVDSLAGLHGTRTVVSAIVPEITDGGMAVRFRRAIAAGLVVAERTDHSVLEFRSPASRNADGGPVTWGWIRPSDWFIAEHEIAGAGVVSGSTQISWLLGQARDHFEGAVTASMGGIGLATVSLSDVLFVEPIVVTGDVAVRVTMDPVRDADGVGLSTEWSMRLDFLDETEMFRTACVATARVIAREPTSSVASMELNATFEAELATNNDSASPARQELEPIKAFAHRPDFVVGERWQGQVSTTGPQRFQLMPYTAAGSEGFDPALLDQAIAVAHIGFRDVLDDGSLWVPVSIGSITSAHTNFGTDPILVSVDTAHRVPTETLTEGDEIAADVTITQASSQVPAEATLRIDGLRLRAISIERLLPPGAGQRLPSKGLQTTPASSGSTQHALEHLSRGLAQGATTMMLGEALRRAVVPGATSKALVGSSSGSSADPASVPTGPGTVGLLDVLIAAWGRLLGEPNVTADSNFFDLGGHSLLGLRLIADLRRSAGVVLTLGDLVESPTPRKLTAFVQSQQSVRSNLVVLRDGNLDKSLFLIHGSGGNIATFTPLAAKLMGATRLVGVQANWVSGGEPDTTIDAMAERYCEEIVAALPNGPFRIGGYSLGGVVALEVGRRLQARGLAVDRIVLLDTSAPGRYESSRFERLKNLTLNALRHGPAPSMAWFKARRLDDPYRAAEEQRRNNPSEELLRALDVDRIYREALGAHNFRSIDIPILFVRSNLLWPRMDSTYGFGRRLGHRVKIVFTSGNHSSMMFTEHAPTLAALLESELGL